MACETYRDGYVEVRSINFHYTDWGAPNGDTLVCLHGITQTAHSWDEFAEAAAAAGYRVVCLDQRGHGDSGWPREPDYDRNTQADDLEAVLEGLALSRPVVVAMSMGGLNAMTWASRPTSDPRALILVDISPEVRVEGVSAIHDFIRNNDVLPSFEAFVERAHAFNPRRSLDNLRSRLGHNLKRLDDGNWTWKYDPALRSPAAAVGDLEGLWAEIAAIDCPTLAVKGAESPVVSPQAIARLTETIADCRSVEIAGAGHSVMGDNPEAFSRAVLLFLDHTLG